MTGVPPSHDLSASPSGVSLTIEEHTNPLTLLAAASHGPAATEDVSATLMAFASAAGDSIETTINQLSLRLEPECLRTGLQYVVGDGSLDTSGVLNQGYFAPRGPRNLRRDVGDGYDPIHAAILEEAELEKLWEAFFALENPRQPMLDALLHTTQFCRQRSALLTTVIAYGIAQHTKGQAALCTRLRKHADYLIKEIYTRHFCSVEILIGLYWFAFWPQVSDHVDEDTSMLPLAHACTIARSMAADWQQPEPNEREQRTRERAMIALTYWDCGSSGAKGTSRNLPDDFVRLASISATVYLRPCAHS